MTIDGAIIIGKAIPAMRPYSAVAWLNVIPLSTRRLGIISAVIVTVKDVRIRIVDSGSVDLKISFVSCGLQMRPPFTKNIIARTRAQARSLTVKAMATAVPPSMALTTPPARIEATAIRTTSSSNSVDEKVKNFFCPQNQLRSEPYMVDVMRVGSIMRNNFTHLSSANNTPRCLLKIRANPTSTIPTESPIMREDVT